MCLRLFLCKKSSILCYNTFVKLEKIRTTNFTKFNTISARQNYRKCINKCFENNPLYKYIIDM